MSHISHDPKAAFAVMRLRAEKAIETTTAGEGGDPETRTHGDWEPYFNMHGDGYVVEQGRRMFACIATVGQWPADYGKATVEFIAMMDPHTVLAMLDMMESFPGQLVAAEMKIAELESALSFWRDGNNDV